MNDFQKEIYESSFNDEIEKIAKKMGFFKSLFKSKKDKERYLNSMKRREDFAVTEVEGMLKSRKPKTEKGEEFYKKYRDTGKKSFKKGLATGVLGTGAAVYGYNKLNKKSQYY